MRGIIYFVIFLSVCSFPQEKIKRAQLQLPDKTSYTLSKTNYSLPVWVTSAETTAYSVHLDVVNIISSDGVLKSINYKLDPDSTDIPTSKTGKLFMVKFDSSEIANLDSGSYSLISVISGRNTEPLKEVVSFKIATSKKFFTGLEEAINWILEHFFTFLWNITQAILLIFVFVFILKMIYSILKINKKKKW